MLQATIVFSKNWEAIHAVKEDGTRKYRYIVNTGSSRSSKTFSLIDCYDLYARSYANKRLTVWRDTRTDCRKTVLVDVLKHLKQTDRYKVGQEYNKTESVFTYSNSSTFEVHGTDDEETVHGLTQSAAWLNEPYKISKDTFDQIDQRTSDFIFIDWNPKKAHWIMDIIKDPRCLVIHSTFRDNPFCPAESKAKILSYQPIKACALVTSGAMTEQQAREYDVVLNDAEYSAKEITELERCRENEFKNSASAYMYDVYGLGLKAEQPNRIFVWEEVPTHAYHEIDAPVFYGCDWGSVDPWGIVEAKYYDGGLYLHERNYLSENEWRTRMTSTERAQVNGSEDGIVTWMFKRLNVPKDRPVICDTNRNSKIRALKMAGWDYAQPAHKPPGSILDGVDVLSNIRVYFTSDSVNLKYEQENYSREVFKGEVLEEPEDGNNHLIDPTRYIALHLQIRGIIKKI
jgi:phage terminase large subunit